MVFFILKIVRIFGDCYIHLMKRKEHISQEREALLLKQFNDRDGRGFGEVYLSFHRDLYAFAGKLFQEVSITPDDVIQDIYMYIWEKKDIRFDSLGHLKSYLYVAIKNHYRNHLEHLKRVNEYTQQMLLDEDQFVVMIAENEVLSVLSSSLDLLPTECAKVFKLCLDGWEIKEIADKLGKSESTVYKQKNEAISILRKKLSKDKLFFIMLLIS
jgi:RNA polymerase sigma-70 factor (ECF subfamily)